MDQLKQDNLTFFQRKAYDLMRNNKDKPDRFAEASAELLLKQIETSREAILKLFGEPLEIKPKSEPPKKTTKVFKEPRIDSTTTNLTPVTKESTVTPLEVKGQPLKKRDQKFESKPLKPKSSSSIVSNAS